MNLSKAFDYLSPLIAKLHAISMELLSVKFLQDHLLNRQQRTKDDFKFIIQKKIISGVHQGSIL